MPAKPEKDPNTKSYLEVNPLPEKGATAVAEKETAKADDFAAFEKIIDHHGVDKEDKRVAPELIWKAKAPEKEEKPAPKAERQPEPEVESDEPEDDDDFERAKAALRRDGFRNKHFAVMERDEILAKGLRAIKRHDKDDEAYRVFKEARSPQGSERVATKAEAPKESAPKQVDLSPVISKLKEKLVLDDEGASTLTELASTIAEHAAAPLRHELEALKSQQTSARESEAERWMQAARVEVGKSFPDLSDPDTFESVVEEMKVLGPSKTYAALASPQERFIACMKDACQRLKLTTEEPSAQQVQADAEGKAQRRYSRSTVSDRTRRPAMTPKEKDWASFNEVADKYGLG